jgi:murein DD-endopeptidase MepM/ murein hydrolase activator NlpD
MKRYILVPLDRRRPVKGHALVGVLAAVVLAVVAGGIGVWLGSQGLVKLEFAAAALASEPAQNKAEAQARPEAEVHSACTGLDAQKQEFGAHIDAVSGQVGEMQAEILRLNALGERLVQMAGLDEEEFDFHNPPPQGGPDTDDSDRPAAIDALAEELAQVLSELDDRERKLTLLEELIMKRHLGESGEQAALSGWPVRSGYITSTFGFRRDPYRGRSAFHKGVDFAGALGSPVLAVSEGVVTFAGKQSGYGNLVEIRHKDGLVTRYGHCQKLLVSEGASISRGQTIATLGSTGRSTGPHVHFEVLVDGKQVNPLPYIDKTDLAVDTRAAAARADG